MWKQQALDKFPYLLDFERFYDTGCTETLPDSFWAHVACSPPAPLVDYFRLYSQMLGMARRGYTPSRSSISQFYDGTVELLRRADDTKPRGPVVAVRPFVIK